MTSRLAARTQSAAGARHEGIWEPMMTLSKILPIALIVMVYAALTAIFNIVHFQFLPVHVVLYDTLIDVVLAGVVTGGMVWLRRRASPLSGEETALALLVGLLVGVIYAISVPTIIDRSLSIYILEKIDQRGGGVKQGAFEKIFQDEYMREQRLVDIRLTEQINSGTILIDANHCVGLTERGRSIVAFTRFYRTNLLPKRREIMGRLTDDLTDPFRHSVTDVDYACVAARP